MGEYDYYWELNPGQETKGPKRTIEFFIDAVKKGKDHILELYNPDSIRDEELYKKSFDVIKRFNIKDSRLETSLARILTNMIGFPEQDKNHLVTVYLSDLLGRFVITPDKDDSLAERACEYSSFRASADYITIVYGINSQPKLGLLRAESECLGNGFTQGKRAMSADDILKNARGFYEHASATASEVLDRDFFRLSSAEKRRWENAARANEKIAEKYEDCLEILRSARCIAFSNN